MWIMTRLESMEIFSVWVQGPLMRMVYLTSKYCVRAEILILLFSRYFYIYFFALLIYFILFSSFSFFFLFFFFYISSLLTLLFICFLLFFISSYYRYDLTVEEAIELGKRAILHATHRDAYSGGTNNGKYTICNLFMIEL